MSGTSRTIKWIAWSVCLAVIIGHVLTLFRLMSLENILQSDYRNFATAAMIARKGEGRNLYNLHTQLAYQKELVEPDYKLDNLLPYINLPFFALLFVPLSYMHPVIAYRLIVLFNIALILAVFFIVKKTLPNLERFKLWPIFLVSFLPFSYSINFAQISPLLAVALFLVYMCFKQQKLFLAGLVASLLLIKVQFILILPFLYLLAKNRKRFALGFLLVFFLIMIINLAVAGPEFFSNYTKIIAQTDSEVFGNRIWMKYTLTSSISLLDLEFLSSKFSIYALNAVLYILLLFVFNNVRKTLSYGLLFAIAVILAVTFAVHVFGHDYVVMLVPIVLLASEAIRSKNTRKKNFYCTVALILFSLPALTLVKDTRIAGFILLTIAMLLLSSGQKVGKVRFRRLESGNRA